MILHKFASNIVLRQIATAPFFPTFCLAPLFLAMPNCPCLMALWRGARHCILLNLKFIFPCVQGPMWRAANSWPVGCQTRTKRRTSWNGSTRIWILNMREIFPPSFYMYNHTFRSNSQEIYPTIFYALVSELFFRINRFKNDRVGSCMRWRDWGACRDTHRERWYKGGGDNIVVNN